jgi:hypothetical protein
MPDGVMSPGGGRTGCEYAAGGDVSCRAAGPRWVVSLHCRRGLRRGGPAPPPSGRVTPLPPCEARQ